MRNRKTLQKIWFAFAILMILGMLMFTLLPLILSSSGGSGATPPPPNPGF
ncbi:MAG: hypothetical protein Q8P83_01235 [bacterium]|nr:hypothetical protein [bacterium]